MIHHPAAGMAPGHSTRPNVESSASGSIVGGSIHEAYLCSTQRSWRDYTTTHFRARGHGDGIPPYERRKRVKLSYVTATSDERARVEAREHRVAVHRAEWIIQGCEDEIGRK